MRFRSASRALLCVALFGTGCSGPEKPADDAGTQVADATSGDANLFVDDGGWADADGDLDTDPSDLGIDEDLGDGERPAIRSVPESCDGADPEGGAAWSGWGNVQHPLIVELAVGEVSEPIFGQVWQEGATDQAGQAAGWEAELVVGPLGADPIAQPRCFRALDAEFNVDEGNNDEYWVRVVVDRPGLFSMFYRYRPPAGAWLYGDLDGSTNGVSAAQGAVLIVEPAEVAAQVNAVTLNLKCRTDEWEARRELIVEALVALDPHVLGFQEDCAAADGPPQSRELAAALADRLDRGFEAFRVETHQANHPEGDFGEGIAMLTAFPIEQHFTIDLPFANFPRKATVMDVRVGGAEQVRLVNTHFDYGGANDAIRADAAAIVTAQKNELPIVITGDFNDTPDSDAYAGLAGAFDDTWAIANPGADGFTMPADSPTRRIDYVFVSGFGVESATLFGDEAGQYLSDHLGLAVDLR